MLCSFCYACIYVVIYSSVGLVNGPALLKLRVIALNWMELSFQYIQEEINTFLNFMDTSCINNIQHFNFQLMHTTLKKRRIIKTF